MKKDLLDELVSDRIPVERMNEGCATIPDGRIPRTVVFD